MKKLIALMLFLLLPSLASAQAVTRIAKNTTLKFCGSIYDATTAKRLTAAVTGIDCEYAVTLPGSTDESAFADLSTAERVVGSVGQFCYTILDTEGNVDGEIRVSCKATNTNAADYERNFSTLPVPLVTLVTTTTTATTATTCTTASTCTNLTNLPTIPANWITAAGIANDAIGATEVADGAIDAGALAADTITAAKIANDSIGATEIADAAVDAATLAADTISAAKVNDDVSTEFATKLLATTIAELSSIPDMATPTVSNILRWVFQYGTGAYKTETTATEKTLLKNDGSTVLAECTVADDGTTFTRGECAAP